MTSLARPPRPATTDGPVVARTRVELHRAIRSFDSLGRPGARTVLVPTMGALHAGHAALLDHARGRGEVLVASIFVNPLQFGPGEDLERYPRSFDEDLQLCARHHVDVVFAPAVEVMYPDGRPKVSVHPGPLAEILDGASRPGHFGGVVTVVAKLFGLVGPHVAVFGEKDYQQLVLIRRMVADLCMPVAVLGVETLREPDGLALSSRNAYLSVEERRAAVALSAALRAGSLAGPAGAEAVLAAAHDVIAAEPGVALDYLEVRSGDLDAPPPRGAARLLVAARVGTTRLVDNVQVQLGMRASEGTPP